MNAVDAVTAKARGRIHIDCLPLHYPKITSMRGRYSVEKFPTEAGEGQQSLLLCYERSHNAPSSDGKHV